MKAMGLLPRTCPSLRLQPKISASRSSQLFSSSRRPAIGVLGGASAATTVSFLQNLVQWSSERDEQALPFIVYSDPQLSTKRAPRTKGTLLESVDRESILKDLRRKRLFLESSGARCIVMPCHVSQSWHAQLSDGCSVPFLDMGQCVADELRLAALRPVEAGTNVRIGVLATGSPLTSKIYQEIVHDLGFEAVLPDKATVEHTVLPALEALTRKDMEGARMLLRIALHVLLVKAVNVIIIASDDLRGLLPIDDPLLRRCVDPIDCLARSTVDWAHSHPSL